jgi:hypothetical protein
MRLPTTTVDTKATHSPLAAVVVAVSPSRQAVGAADSCCSPSLKTIRPLTRDHCSRRGVRSRWRKALLLPISILSDETHTSRGISLHPSFIIPNEFITVLAYRQMGDPLMGNHCWRTKRSRFIAKDISQTRLRRPPFAYLRHSGVRP